MKHIHLKDISEDQLQRELIKHIRYRSVSGALTQCVNNNPRSGRDGKRLVASGLTKGWPDLIHVFMPHANPLNGCAIVFHELKTKKGRLSDEQKDTHKKLTEAGATVYTTFGLDAAIQLCIDIGLIRG